MPVTKCETFRSFPGQVLSSSEPVESWSGDLIDRVSQKVRVTVFQPSPERPDNIITVRVGPYRDYYDHKTGEFGSTEQSPHVIVYKNESIRKMPFFLGKGFRDRLVGFVWNPVVSESLVVEEIQ